MDPTECPRCRLSLDLCTGPLGRYTRRWKYGLPPGGVGRKGRPLLCLLNSESQLFLKTLPHAVFYPQLETRIPLGKRPNGQFLFLRAPGQEAQAIGMWQDAVPRGRPSWAGPSPAPQSKESLTDSQGAAHLA